MKTNEMYVEIKEKYSGKFAYMPMALIEVSYHLNNDTNIEFLHPEKVRKELEEFLKDE